MSETMYEMIKSAMNVIKRNHCEQFIIQYNEEGGFMFSNNEKINKIKSEIEDDYGGHSGASLAQTMRSCQYLLSNIEEWNKFKSDFE
jgi:hypothetical protein